MYTFVFGNDSNVYIITKSVPLGFETVKRKKYYVLNWLTIIKQEFKYNNNNNNNNNGLFKMTYACELETWISVM